MTQLTEALASLDVLEPSEHETLRAYGIRWPGGSEGARYVTLDEALKDDKLEVTEVDEGGQVPQLKVINKGDTMVFLMAGEELIGAKQNRVLNVSIMVKANSDQPIPVSCVEAGRWSYRSRKFQSLGTASHSSLRSMMSKQIGRSYSKLGKPISQQQAVWGEVSGKLERMKSLSSSSELHQVYRDRKKQLDTAVSRLAAPEGCSGAVFTSGNRVLGLDLFDKPETLTKLWPKLVRSYAIDALEDEEPGTPLSSDKVREWLASLAGAKAETFKSPGVGDDVRLESGNAHGGALLVDSSPIHVELFTDATR
jgi:hypothetical protein